MFHQDYFPTIDDLKVRFQNSTSMHQFQEKNMMHITDYKIILLLLVGISTRHPETRQDLGPGTSRGLAEESRDNKKVLGLFVHYSAMHKHRSVNYLNLARRCHIPSINFANGICFKFSKRTLHRPGHETRRPGTSRD